MEILSLDYEYDGETFEIEDTSQPSVENLVLNKLCPAPTEEELQIQLLAHFDKENPRYAQIIRLKLLGKSIDEICVEINLKPSRGRQEINTARGRGFNIPLLPFPASRILLSMQILISFVTVQNPSALLTLKIVCQLLSAHTADGEASPFPASAGSKGITHTTFQGKSCATKPPVSLDSSSQRETLSPLNTPDKRKRRSPLESPCQ